VFSEVRLTSVLGNHILCEVRSLLPKRFVKQEKCRKKMPTTSKIVANLSPVGKDVGLHAHPCAGEKGKPVVRHGAQSLRVSYLTGRRPGYRTAAAGSQSSALREGRGCGCDLTFWGINRESPLRQSSEIHRRMFSPRAAESQERVHLRDVLVYTGGGTFSGARERKDEIVGTIAEPRKGPL
jgi:hypothetical protein